MRISCLIVRATNITLRSHAIAMVGFNPFTISRWHLGCVRLCRMLIFIFTLGLIILMCSFLSRYRRPLFSQTKSNQIKSILSSLTLRLNVNVNVTDPSSGIFVVTYRFLFNVDLTVLVRTSLVYHLINAAKLTLSGVWLWNLLAHSTRLTHGIFWCFWGSMLTKYKFLHLTIVFCNIGKEQYVVPTNKKMFFVNF